MIVSNGAYSKVCARGSIVLNVALLFYISLLYGGWTSPGALPLPQARSIHNFAGNECESISSPGVSDEGSEDQTTRGGEPPSAGLANFKNRHVIGPGVTCLDKEIKFRQGQRADYWVLYNYIRAEKIFSCHESITYTTHGDFTFLDNLEPLLVRWQGPVSLSVFSPGEDFEKTVSTILFYRQCRNNTLVRDFVTFHIFFNLRRIPTQVPQHQDLLGRIANCSEKFDWGEGFQTFKKLKKLTYPVNVARNVARESSQTHFVFPSDIELYPSPGTIPNFLDMVRRGDGPGSPLKPRVYVNSIFEIEANATNLPKDKKELIQMLKKGIVIPFHKQVCPQCHKIPYAKNWTEEAYRPGMRVLHVGKRIWPYQHWEPIYIGTNEEPLYDERLSWEGRADKMTQGYKMCVLDYEFHILDNAFLVHRPGIKTKSKLKIDNSKVAAQNTLISKTIFPQVKTLYGERKGCEMW